MPRESKKQETPFERKLKDIEREKRRVQSEIKSLSKALRRGDLPPPISSVQRTPLRGTPPPAPNRTPSPVRAQRTALPDATVELFEWEKGRETSNDAPVPQSEQPVIAEKKKTVHGDERFSNYFSAGGFKSPMPARQERSVQRNKAVFTVVLVIIVGYIIFTVFIQ